MSTNFPLRNSETQSSPISIVPLHVPELDRPEVAAAAPPAQLVYNNGPLLTNVQVYTIFWGSAWQQSPASDTVTNINSISLLARSWTNWRSTACKDRPLAVGAVLAQ